LDEQPDSRAEMIERTGRRTVPQIYIGGRHIGGHDDIVSLDKSGDLDVLLRESS
jgi:glutaredoxin 3